MERLLVVLTGILIGTAILGAVLLYRNESIPVLDTRSGLGEGRSIVAAGETMRWSLAWDGTHKWTAAVREALALVVASFSLRR